MSINILESYARVFVEEHELDQTSFFYQELLNGRETQRFSYPEKHLVIATVSSRQLSILIVGGSEEHRVAFAKTRLTIAVESLDSAVLTLLGLGASQVQDIQATPQGRNMRFIHPDGLVVEYVENKLAGAMGR
jgi:hypothetical protein